MPPHDDYWLTPKSHVMHIRWIYIINGRPCNIREILSLFYYQLPVNRLFNCSLFFNQMVYPNIQDRDDSTYERN